VIATSITDQRRSLPVHSAARTPQCDASVSDIPEDDGYRWVLVNSAIQAEHSAERPELGSCATYWLYGPSLPESGQPSN